MKRKLKPPPDTPANLLGRAVRNREFARQAIFAKYDKEDRAKALAEWESIQKPLEYYMPKRVKVAEPKPKMGTPTTTVNDEEETELVDFLDFAMQRTETPKKEKKKRAIQKRKTNR